MFDLFCFAATAAEGNLRYHEFFHAEGHRAFHDQLSGALCERMYPPLLAAVKADARRRGVEVRNADVLVDFIVHGQTSLMSSPNMPSERTIKCLREYIDVLLKSQTTVG